MKNPNQNKNLKWNEYHTLLHTALLFCQGINFRTKLVTQREANHCKPCQLGAASPLCRLPGWMNPALNGAISPHDESDACAENLRGSFGRRGPVCKGSLWRAVGYLWVSVWRSPTHWSVWLRLRVNSGQRISQRCTVRNGGERVPGTAVEKLHGGVDII